MYFLGLAFAAVSVVLLSLDGPSFGVLFGLLMGMCLMTLDGSW